jgi:hypothetical protein
MTRTILAAVAAFAITALSHAGISAGTYVSRNDLSSATFTDASDPAGGYGTYQSSLQGTTASLQWQANSVAITGNCSGSSTLIARSQAIAILQINQPTTTVVQFSMNQTVRAGNQVGWAIVDAGTSDSVLGVSHDGTAFVVAGGAPSAGSGTATTTLQPGTYLLVMLAECTSTGGTFSLNASLTAVPTGPTLHTTARPTVAVGDVFTASVGISGMASDAVGVQARVLYDPTALQFVAFDPGTDFPTALYVSASPGAVTFATGVPAGGGSGVRAGQVARVTFRAIAPRCADANPIALASTGFPTRITALGGGALSFTLSDDVAVTALVPFALSGVPNSISGLPADAGVRGAGVASYAGAVVTAQDSCGHPLAPSLTAQLPDGSTLTQMPAAFPVGTTTLTWTATDAAGQVTTATRTVVIDDRQVLRIDATLAGAVGGNSTRPLSVSYAGATSAQNASVPFTQRTGTVIASVSPALTGTPACASVKDTLHSLRALAVPAVVGTEYVATATLVQGDSNDDNSVDILDFGVYVGDATAGGVTPSSRSNFNADGVIGTADFTFISANFLASGATCGSSWTGGGARPRISVRELRRMGLGDLAIADLNADSWVDTADMVAWMQGATPTAGVRDRSAGRAPAAD